ncbi:hypothetical protein [Phytohabitans houttuyneae]|uniref:ASCH domain-containing protein n=1 Tax=Phytohabitans houttuyneae TaxID=1076126 RepID=A0A6V8KAP6_9ACTN|nr:hypothetical protein [Phytohabitans houttuyneae]GFJ79531.1 hypothetical protein Phou_037110 [Phytohabitans houttuyneae]
MKAITVRAPWCIAIAAGAKPVENRTRPTSYRGPVAIHAAASWAIQGGDDPRVRAWWWGDPAWRHRPSLESGDFAYAFRRVIAVTNLNGCHQAEPGCCTTPWADQPTAAVPIVWHLELADTVRIDPVGPLRGQLAVPWRLPVEAAAAVTANYGLATAVASLGQGGLLSKVRAAFEEVDPAPGELVERSRRLVVGGDAGA